MLEKQLEELGLSDKEAKVYIATLEIGQGSASEISKKSGVNRATTYFTLENLMKAGLVSASSEEKKQLFSPEDPAQLENIITKKQQDLENQKKGLKGLVDELSSINSAGIKKPIVKYYLGKEGMMQMAISSFSDVRDEMMWISFSANKLNKFLTEEQNNRLRKKRISQNIKTTVLYNSDSENLPVDENNKRIRVNSDDYPCPGDVAIYKDKIRLSSYDDQIGIIIENKEIAQTLKSIFKLAVESAENKSS